MKTHWLDLVVLAIYFISMAWLGIYFSKRNKDTEQYFVGGRSFGGWVLGLSLVGYSISSVTFIAYPGDAFKTAWIRFIPCLMLPVGVLLAAWLFVPFFRRINVTSAFEFLEGRFGSSIRIYSAIAFILGQLLRLSIILYLVAIVVSQMTGLDTTLCILIAGLVTALYTLMGGIDAVIWTDVIQAIVLLFGGLLCLGVIAYNLPGGFGQIITTGLADGKLAFADLIDGKIQPLSWNLSITQKTGSMMLLLGLTQWMTEYCSNQNTVQRFVASKSTQEARKAIYICAASSLPIWAMFMFIGTALYVFFKVYPTPETTAMLTGARKAEEVLPFFITKYMPPGVVGLVIAGLLAAAMSSLSASINATTTVSVVDLYKRLIARNKDDRHYLKAAWVVTGIVSLIMLVGAVMLVKLPTMTLQDTSLILGSLLGGGVLGIYMLGIFTSRGDARAAWVGIVCTLLFTGWTILCERHLLPERFSAPFNLYYTMLFGNLLMFVVGALVGTFIFRQQRDVSRFTYWHKEPKTVEAIPGALSTATVKS
jgi:SSS family solute:Na+ symporter